MRFVIAIVLFVGAFLSIGYGLAQRTILAGPDELVASAEFDDSSQITVIDGETLNAEDGRQTITVRGDGPIVAAWGRTADVRGWVGDSAHTDIGYDTETQVLTADAVSGEAAVIPSPLGSDLWLGERTADDEMVLRFDTPEDVSLMFVGGAPVVAEGEAAADPEAVTEPVPAPGDISVRWPVDNSAPWSGPLITGGAIALLLGLVAFVWALVHARRRRGPRRKPPRLPRPPKPPRLTARSQKPPKAIEPNDRRSRRRATMVVPALAVTGLLLAGCTSGPLSEVFGGGDATPTPTPTASEEGPQTELIAVTQRQFGSILEKVTTTVAEADAAGDAEIAAQRLAGPALELRTANYTMRSNDEEIALPPAIPGGEVDVLLPQQNDGWPRTVFAVVSDPDETVAPQALMLIQESARDQYKLNYAITLEPSATLPDVAGADVGASRLGGDFSFLKLAPQELATAYGDILENDTESTFAELFESEGDSLRSQLGVAYKEDRIANLPGSAEIAFANEAGTGATVAFGTIDSGALVAVHEYESETVTPAETGAAINPVGTVAALSGVTSTTTGIQARYGLQLLFYVPSVTSDDDQKIRLLGFTQGLVNAEETE